jgi:hypothetical protein
LFSHPRWPAWAQDWPDLPLHTASAARGVKLAADTAHARVRSAMMLFILDEEVWYKKCSDVELVR